MNIKELKKREARDYGKKHRKLYPWKFRYASMKQRCTNPNTIGYKNYGGKGVKLLMTENNLKELWFRDKAWKLKAPSIDRIDSNGNYEVKNCRFIERSENARLGVIGKKRSRASIEKGNLTKIKPLSQWSLDGKFIKKWIGTDIASKGTGVLRTAINNNLKGRSLSAGGYVWKYENV